MLYLYINVKLERPPNSSSYNPHPPEIAFPFIGFGCNTHNSRVSKHHSRITRSTSPGALSIDSTQVFTDIKAVAWRAPYPLVFSLSFSLPLPFSLSTIPNTRPLCHLKSRRAHKSKPLESFTGIEGRLMTVCEGATARVLCASHNVSTQNFQWMAEGWLFTLFPFSPSNPSHIWISLTPNRICYFVCIPTYYTIYI